MFFFAFIFLHDVSVPQLKSFHMDTRIELEDQKQEEAVDEEDEKQEEGTRSHSDSHVLFGSHRSESVTLLSVR